MATMPKSDKKVMTIRVESTLYRRLKDEAERTYRPVASVIYEAIDLYLKIKERTNDSR
jgi:predicted DNA-binding protein